MLIVVLILWMWTLSRSVWLQVRVGYIYLSRVLKVQFPGLRHRAAVAEAEARAVEVRDVRPPMAP